MKNSHRRVTHGGSDCNSFGMRTFIANLVWFYLRDLVNPLVRRFTNIVVCACVCVSESLKDLQSITPQLLCALCHRQQIKHNVLSVLFVSVILIILFSCFGFTHTLFMWPVAYKLLIWNYYRFHILFGIEIASVSLKLKTKIYEPKKIWIN